MTRRLRTRIHNSPSLRALPGPDANRAELLVDGDSHSIAEVTDAIQVLSEKGHAVHTTVYAEPRRELNRKWREFFEDTSISFRPIPRRVDGLGEANDEAMTSDLRHIARSCTNTSALCIALLTSDRDFVQVIEEVREENIEVMVLIPYRHVNSIQAYQEAGVRVMPIEQQQDCSPKVRAILHHDGSGSVAIGGPCTFMNYEAEAEAVKPLLEDLGYCQQASHHLARPFLGHAAAKFWYNHGLGDIEVFPSPCAITALHHLIQQRGDTQQWQPYQEKLAFILPCASRKGRSKASAVRRYGSLRDRQIYQGGGPFIIHNSDDVVTKALQRLGYVDQGLNESLAEAILVFMNTTHNKGTLRKMGLLPEASDSVAVAVKKLHMAFTSTASPGIWQIIPSDRFLRRLLHKYGFLEDTEARQDTVFQAMQAYAECFQIPRMESYNGYAFWIMQSLHEVSSDPSRTGVVQFNLQLGKGEHQEFE